VEILATSITVAFAIFSPTTHFQERKIEGKKDENEERDKRKDHARRKSGKSEKGHDCNIVITGQ
jgi:hypothetical protein